MGGERRTASGERVRGEMKEEREMSPARNETSQVQRIVAAYLQHAHSKACRGGGAAVDELLHQGVHQRSGRNG